MANRTVKTGRKSNTQATGRQVAGGRAPGAVQGREGNVVRVTERSTDTSVVVIGAGHAGLSVAYYLRRLGLDPGNEIVLLRPRPGPGGAWQFRWEALRLGYAHRVNDLPGMEELGVSFDTADRHAPAKDVVSDFYRRYEEHYALQVVRPANVTKVDPTPDGFLVHFEGEYGPREVT